MPSTCCRHRHVRSRRCSRGRVGSRELLRDPAIAGMGSRARRMRAAGWADEAACQPGRRSHRFHHRFYGGERILLMVARELPIDRLKSTNENA